MSYASDYSPRYEVAAYAPPTERAAFIRNTYLHLAGAILAFVGIEAALLSWIGHLQDAEAVRHLILAPGTFFVLMIVFMAGGYLGNYWARSSASPAMQYVGLGLYVVVQAVIFLPLMIIAVFYTGDPTLIPKAGIMTLSLFAGLTAAAFITRKDFSFLGPIIAIASFAALGLIVAAMIFPNAINLGLWFSFAIVALSAASILYTTSNMMRYYSTNMHVAAALALFASVAQMFYYILIILLQSQRR
jgi:FtsH-binding integral membrane protein